MGHRWIRERRVLRHFGRSQLPGACGSDCQYRVSSSRSIGNRSDLSFGSAAIFFFFKTFWILETFRISFILKIILQALQLNWWNSDPRINQSLATSIGPSCLYIPGGSWRKVAGNWWWPTWWIPFHIILESQTQPILKKKSRSYSISIDYVCCSRARVRAYCQEASLTPR